METAHRCVKVHTRNSGTTKGKALSHPPWASQTRPALALATALNTPLHSYGNRNNRLIHPPLHVASQSITRRERTVIYISVIYRKLGSVTYRNFPDSREPVILLNPNPGFVGFTRLAANGSERWFLTETRDRRIVTVIVFTIR
jgi:hypothetical protein